MLGHWLGYSSMEDLRLKQFATENINPQRPGFTAKLVDAELTVPVLKVESQRLA
jgi:hypothetical protein